MKDRLRILHLEDEPDYSDFVRAILAQAGIDSDLSSVATQAEFEAACRTGTYALILADYSLPNYTGVQALHHASKHCPETPFILLSGTIGEPAAIESLRAGATDYVLKQWPERLPPAIQRALHEARLRQRQESEGAALAKLGWRLNSATTQKEAARIIYGIADELFGCDAFSLSLFDSMGRLLDPVLEVDLLNGQRVEMPPDRLERVASPMARRVMERGAELILRDPDALPPTDTWRFGDRSRISASLMVVPLRNTGTALGVVAVQSYQTNAYDESQLEVLQMLTDHCGGALERIRAERASREMESRFYELFDRSPDAILVENEAGQILDVNRAACQLYGWPSEELIGRPIAELFPPEQRTGLVENFEKLFRGEVTRLDGEGLAADGRVVPVEIRTGRIQFGGQPALLLHVRDVSQQRRLEEQFRQSQKMEAIGQLAGGVAHDFNNILTVIHGHASMLATAPGLSENAERSARQIVQASERAAGLTRQLLTFSRRQVMQTRRLDLNEVVRNITKLLARILGEDIALKVRYADAAPMVQADESMMEQVVMNLAVNARDAMPDGGELALELAPVEFAAADLGVGLHPEIRPGKFVRLRVSDTGTGISPEHLPHIFEPFFTTKAKGRGTGLGLATVYGVLKQHQGWIEVDSRLQWGSSFMAFLPAAPGEPAQADATPAGTPGGGSETILLVEDEEPVREMVGCLLQARGYHVIEAESGVRALEIWERESPRVDLLLTDLVMPGGVNGRELAGILRGKRPQLRVVYMSGYSADVLGREFVVQPGLDFLQKPFDPDRLCVVVRESLDAGNAGRTAN